MKKRNRAIIGVLVGYVVVVVCATLFVPVKATIFTIDTEETETNVEPYAEYGYYPIWEVGDVNETGKTPVMIEINVTSWIIQYIFITLVFASMLLQTHRHFSRE